MKNNTINKEEIDKFSKIAEEWWNPAGKFKPLHKFNPIRISYIKNNIISTLKLKDNNKPLEKIKILDIGCGGGLLSEPMCRLGASVVGIDASDKNIKVAKLHAEKNNLNIDYYCASPETFETKIKCDVILNMEIVEHVEDVDFFLKSYLFAIVGAEYILKWLPIGTHEWEKFVKPENLIDILKKYNLSLDALDGMKFNLITDRWSLSSDKSINYIGKFIKN